MREAFRVLPEIVWHLAVKAGDERATLDGPQGLGLECRCRSCLHRARRAQKMAEDREREFGKKEACR